MRGSTKENIMGVVAVFVGMGMVAALVFFGTGIFERGMQSVIDVSQGQKSLCKDIQPTTGNKCFTFCDKEKNAIGQEICKQKQEIDLKQFGGGSREMKKLTVCVIVVNSDNNVDVFADNEKIGTIKSKSREPICKDFEFNPQRTVEKVRAEAQSSMDQLKIRWE